MERVIIHLNPVATTSEADLMTLGYRHFVGADRYNFFCSRLLSYYHFPQTYLTSSICLFR